MTTNTDYIASYFEEAKQVIDLIDKESIGKIIDIIKETKEEKGRLFFLGVGGSAANASHAVNDFRKIAGIEAYTPVDNVSELTARTNDEGWDSVFTKWLKGSRVRKGDTVFILSVGGGNAEKKVSVNLIKAIDTAKESGAKVVGIAGKDGGYTKSGADACVLIPVVNQNTITPHSEAFQSVVLHLIVTHPVLKEFEMKWESTK